MAWTVTKDWDYSTETGKSITLPVIDFANNYAEKTQSGDGLTFADTTAPIDRPALTHLEWHQKSNIYTNTGIDRAYWAPSVRGMSVFMQQNNTYSITDGQETFYAPISTSISIKTLMHEAMTADVVLAHVIYSLAQLYDKQSNGSTRLARLMRGALDITK